MKQDTTRFVCSLIDSLLCARYSEVRQTLCPPKRRPITMCVATKVTSICPKVLRVMEKKAESGGLVGATENEF